MRLQFMLPEHKCFLKNYYSELVLLKVDIKNAFNTVQRNVVLQNVKNIISILFSYFSQCYNGFSNLF